MNRKSLLVNILFLSGLMISFVMSQTPGDDEDNKRGGCDSLDD